MSFDNSFKKLTESMEKRDTMRFGFQKQILLMASTLLGVLVSLHTPDNTGNSTVLWILAMGTLPLSILSGLAALYGQVFVAKKAFLGVKEAVHKQLRENSTTFDPVLANEPSIFGVFEVIFYISFSLSIVFLALYAILLG